MLLCMMGTNSFYFYTDERIGIIQILQEDHGWVQEEKHSGRFQKQYFRYKYIKYTSFFLHLSIIFTQGQQL